MATKLDSPDSATDLLNAAYTQLEFDRGDLLSAGRNARRETMADWIEKGDWQLLAAQVGAESIFFVDREPVVVFAKSDKPDSEILNSLYERIWCMSRPQVLFLAAPGQLSAFDLTKPPPKPNESLMDRDRLIATATSLAEVQLRLGALHRERIETGVFFEEDRFRDSANRSDRALIRDLKTVRRQLASVQSTGQRPALGHLHSLIGRAIFIRYLEDREILVPAYFEKVANRNRRWANILAQEPTAPLMESRLTQMLFLRVLQDKDFTYALFEQLALDFNGDTFPIDDEERESIKPDHLNQLRNFLIGKSSDQEELFFFAYRFDVIPIELISTIYEEFYNERTGKDGNHGSHYTRPALVEFVLGQTLTPEVLASKPRVIDPACGSGIFLVESFRRMVRHQYAEQNGRRVSRPQLRKILRDQIAGIDINEEAVRVAAFSLYLAFLHYQEPREINDDRRLPYLKWVSMEERLRREQHVPGGEFLDILLYANSFDVIAGSCSSDLKCRFGSNSASIVVGNPPWGSPKKDDLDGRQAAGAIKAWCLSECGRPIGDKERSQAFIHLSLELLRDGGRAGLLVSSGVLFKHHKNSREFRRIWLQSVQLEHIVNFSHVRHVFFSEKQREAKAVSPFISVVFRKTENSPPVDSRFQYWSAKRSAVVQNTRAVILNRGDMHWLSQRDCLEYEKLWKIYWWGGHRDEGLIRRIEQYSRLSELSRHFPGTTLQSGRGFEVLSSGSPSDWLKKYKELPVQCFRKYGKQPLAGLRDVPDRVYRKGLEAIYDGHRLLVGRGIKRGGHIVARFETQTYCFRNSIHGVRFDGLEKWQEAVITAVFWSSLARYFYFMTSGSWGFWHDEIHLDDVENLPIPLPSDARRCDKIVRIVEELQNIEPTPDGLELGGARAHFQLHDLEQELDDAVFDLYQLSSIERELVQEMCSLGIDLFYQKQKSAALKETYRPTESVGTLANVARAETSLPGYLRVFLECWTEALGDSTELAWQIHSPPSRAPLLAVSFFTHDVSTPLPSAVGDETTTWNRILAKLDKSSLVPADSSRILFDTFFRHIGDRDILFVKRNEERFWTRTAAREDAESALAYILNHKEAVAGN